MRATIAFANDQAVSFTPVFSSRVSFFFAHELSAFVVSRSNCNHNRPPRFLELFLLERLSRDASIRRIPYLPTTLRTPRLAMIPRKKLQVFVSSTYEDLKEERQAAVEAILSAGHIPAGMELFAAGNESQMEVIRNWIDESEVFLLITRRSLRKYRAFFREKLC